MDAGLMIAQMLVGLPATPAMPATSAVTAMTDDEREASAFAGLLQDMSANDTTSPAIGAVSAQALPAGNSDTMKEEPAPAQAAATPDSMAMLLAMAYTGNNVTSSSPAIEAPSLEQPEKPEHQDGNDPQNVVVSLAGMQALAAQRTYGTPVSAAMLADAAPQPARIADAGELLGGQEVVKPETTGVSRVDASTMQSQAFAGLLSDSYSMPVSAMRQNAVASTSAQQNSTAAQAVSSPATQPGADITGTKNTAGQEVQNVVREMPSVVSVPAQPEKMLATEPVKTPDTAVSKQPETATMKSSIQPVSETGLQTTAIPPGGSEAQTTPAEQAVSSLPVVEGMTRDAQVVLAGRLQVDGKRNISQAAQEPQTSKPEAGVEGVESRMSGNAVAVAIKKTMAPSSGESFGQDGDSASGQKMGTQDHLALLHQVKAESVPVVTNASGSTAGEPVRANVMEQVVNQVKDHLAGLDNKSGTQQVMIRLSPENLGELKLNLQMENQSLRVSIVAENNQVRDSLIKHSDTLKETLARQNITMESFDVSTESNGSGASLYGQSQNSWQEMTQQQRSTAWNTAKGYRIDDTPEMAQRPLYQASAEYSMVDVHF